MILYPDEVTVVCDKCNSSEIKLTVHEYAIDKFGIKDSELIDEKWKLDDGWYDHLCPDCAKQVEAEEDE